MLAVARDLIDQHGEHGLRVDEVAQRSGMSIGALYYHFTDREGLVRAVRERELRDDTERAVSALALPGEALAARSAEEFVRALMDRLRSLHAPELAAARLHRHELIGSMLARPELVEFARAATTEVIDAYCAMAEVLESKGFLRAGVSPRGFALYLRSLNDGRVQGDLDLHEMDMDEWMRIVETTVRSLLRVDVGARPA